MAESFLVLHGWGGNKPTHWQEHLNAALVSAGADVHYPKMPDPMSPNLAAWQAALREEIQRVRVGPPLTVVCHSLGGINWLHYVDGASERIADRVLLLAPPYVIREIPPWDAPPSVSEFFPPPMNSEAVALSARETAIIASNDDDYATFEQSKTYADRLRVPIHLLADAGHISPYWGYGEWPWILDWCLGRAELPPQPRTSD